MPVTTTLSAAKKSGFILAAIGSFGVIGAIPALLLTNADCTDCGACGARAAPPEQPADLQSCAYTRRKRAVALGDPDAATWGFATCWMTAVSETRNQTSGIGGTLEILKTEIWGFRGGLAFRIDRMDDPPLAWCENRSRDGTWDTGFWKGFAQWDRETCQSRTTFTILPNEILHVGTRAFDARSFDDVQCVVTARTTGGVRFDVGVDYRANGDAPAWPAVEGGFSGWAGCDEPDGIRVASARIAADGTSSCDPVR